MVQQLFLCRVKSIVFYKVNQFPLPTNPVNCIPWTGRKSFAQVVGVRLVPQVKKFSRTSSKKSQIYCLHLSKRVLPNSFHFPNNPTAFGRFPTCLLLLAKTLAICFSNSLHALPSVYIWFAKITSELTYSRPL